MFLIFTVQLFLFEQATSMAILTVLKDDDTSSSLATVISIALVLEVTIVLTDLSNLPAALVHLHGIYLCSLFYFFRLTKPLNDHTNKSRLGI